VVARKLTFPAYDRLATIVAATKTQIEKERAEAPQDRTERLIAEDEYKLLMHRVEVAETQAHSEKLGIWSYAMKQERVTCRHSSVH
jgi:hypothetical protein